MSTVEDLVQFGNSMLYAKQMGYVNNKETFGTPGSLYCMHEVACMLWLDLFWIINFINQFDFCCPIMFWFESALQVWMYYHVYCRAVRNKKIIRYFTML